MNDPREMLANLTGIVFNPDEPPLVVVPVDPTNPGPLTAPRPQAIVPSAGPVGGGIMARIDGVGFTPGCRVRFGAAEAQIQLLQPTRIDLVVPAGSAGPSTVRVIDSSGAQGALPAPFTYLAPAQVVTGVRVVQMPPGGSAATGPTMLSVTLSPGDMMAVAFSYDNSLSLVERVDLTFSGLPPATTMRLDPTDPRTYQNITAELVTSQTGTPPGQYTIDFLCRGKTTNAQYPTLTLRLTVQAERKVELGCPAAVLLPPGTSLQVPISVRRMLVPEPVTFLLDGPLPPGVTASFDPFETTGDATTLRLAASPSVALGTTRVRVDGVVAPGIAVRGAPLDLRVAQPGTLSITPSLRTIAAGGMATYRVQTDTTGLIGPLTLRTVAVPNVSTSFTPPQLGPAVSTTELRVTTSPNVRSGRQVLEVEATGAQGRFTGQAELEIAGGTTSFLELTPPLVRVRGNSRARFVLSLSGEDRLVSVGSLLSLAGARIIVQQLGSEVGLGRTVVFDMVISGSGSATLLVFADPPDPTVRPATAQIELLVGT